MLGRWVDAPNVNINVLDRHVYHICQEQKSFLTNPVVLISKNTTIMVGLLSLSKAVLLVAAGALASVNYPPIPEDLSTPFQRRLAVYGPNGKMHIDTVLRDIIL